VGCHNKSFQFQTTKQLSLFDISGDRFIATVWWQQHSINSKIVAMKTMFFYTFLRVLLKTQTPHTIVLVVASFPLYAKVTLAKFTPLLLGVRFSGLSSGRTYWAVRLSITALKLKQPSTKDENKTKKHITENCSHKKCLSLLGGNKLFLRH
jgi:hypothetical protein